MQNRIFVTGVGIVSSIGFDVNENFQSLQKMETGIGQVEHLQTIHNDTFVLGEVKASNQELLNRLKINNVDSSYSRTALLGLLAARQATKALDEAEISNIAFVSSTTVGGMDNTELNLNGNNYPSDYINTHPCGSSTDFICEQLGIKAYRTTISTACSSSANAVMHGVRLLQSGVANRVLVGGVDALSKFTLNGFNSLMILDKAHCRPFDNSRAGLNLGEGAGFLLLESSPNVSDDSDILCELTGWANANDAYHQTASSPEGIGAFKAMNEAITQSGINPAEIDYINAHGTGTQNNDYSEGVAIKRLFGTNIPAFSSTKAYTGHTLGAAAGIEAVFSVLAILNNCVFPNLNFKTPMDELNITPQLSFEKRQINHVLSNSFGFGGNNSSLIFSKNK